MALFSEALRESKLLTLPPSSVARSIKSSNVPRYQILQAPSASASRKEWGLKFPVVDAKQKQVEFQSFQDRYGTNGVNSFPSFARKVTNLENLGAPVTLPRSRRLRSLYDTTVSLNNSAHSSARHLKGLEYLSEAEYAKKLRQAKEIKTSPNISKAAALEQIGVATYDPTGNLEPAKWQHSSIGATYASPGVLRNSPRGILARQTVKARALPGRAHRGAVAFGGFVATDVNGTTAQVPWYETIDLSVSSIGGTASGDIQINVHRETPQNVDSSSRLLDRAVNV